MRVNATGLLIGLMLWFTVRPLLKGADQPVRRRRGYQGGTNGIRKTNRLPVYPVGCNRLVPRQALNRF